ncbi:MAG: M42 family metallopeptidase [Acetivibrionales bacterium]|jgi:putative aminopeptidase FrvX
MFLKDLTELNGVSGNEEPVCRYIMKKISKYTNDITVDSMGNLIAIKNGTDRRHKLMVSAHMDEVGLMVSGYGENGTIKFKQVGGIDERILIGKKVLIGDKKIPGVIGCKPIHLQEKQERKKNIKQKDMYIDIGAESKEDAENLAPLGEYISFKSEYTELGADCIKAKALDDRIGCAILMEILKGQYSFDLAACFTVQEEIGLRGAEVVSYSVNPDLALVIEGTTCSDVPGAEEYEYSTLLGNGAVLTIMDRTSVADKSLVDYIYKVALKNRIPVQFKRTATGGNDAGRINVSRSGVKVASISVPCRYIHSPVSVMNKNDYTSCRNLLKEVLNELSKNRENFDVIRNGGELIV